MHHLVTERVGFHWESGMASFDEVKENTTFSNFELWPLKKKASL